MRTPKFLVPCVIVGALGYVGGCGGSPDQEQTSTTSAPLQSPVVVTIQFDDGTADQYAALTILNNHNMHATFYVNSGVIDDSAHMSWTQLGNLYGAGNEIAGHTVDHTNIKKLSTAAARQEVCGDRVTLFNHGFQPTSFAYPFGSFDTASKQVVADCGYNSGRGVSGVDDKSVFAETIPPRDAYATRTPTNPKRTTKVSTIEGYITAAEQHGGGWVQLVFHQLCDSCGAYSITPAHFTELLDWLALRAPNTVVKTTTEVVGGAFKPAVAP
ncbi:MAG: polysaccharide deacetylase family protein [Polyangiales bacterium]